MVFILSKFGLVVTKVKFFYLSNIDSNKCLLINIVCEKQDIFIKLKFEFNNREQKKLN